MTATRPEPNVDVPAELALLAVDMEKYSKMPEAGMDAVRCDVDDILDTVLADCRLPSLDDLEGYKDSGDGAFLLFPFTVLARLVDPLLSRLAEALRRYHREQLTDSPLVRLRVSIHAGPLSLPRHRGDAINDTARLLNSEAARQALAAATDNGGFLAAVISELAYDYTVQAGRTPDLSEHHFLKTHATVANKPGYQAPCRVHVPNLSGSALHAYLTDTTATAPAHAPASAGTATAPSAGGTFHFHKELHDPTIANTIEHLDRRRY
ncbi:hypothetical protein [Streptomyces sp. SGAir0957]